VLLTGLPATMTMRLAAPPPACAYPDLCAAAGVAAGAGPSIDTICIEMNDAKAPFYAAT
jgi:hypothetical protein